MLISEDEKDMQTMLDYVSEWCRKWQLVINTNKSKVMHFRQTKVVRSSYDFKFGTESLVYVSD